MKYNREYRNWIRYLGDVIERECAKPDGKADMRLVGECESLLGDMVAAAEGVTFSHAALAARLDGIKAREEVLRPLPRRAKRPVHAGRLAACAALAVAVGLGGILSAGMALGALRRGDEPPVKTDLSETTAVSASAVPSDGIRFESLGRSGEYENIETLLSAQGLEIPYPSILPAGVVITEVTMDVTAEPATVTYHFSEPMLTMSVSLNTAADEALLSADAEVYAAGGMTSYLRATSDGYSATVLGDGAVAVISCASRETVKEVLDGMAQSAPVRVLGIRMDTYGGYLFFAETVTYNHRPHEVLRRLDPRTGEISTPCVSAGCDHNEVACPFFSGGNGLGFQILGDWIMITEQYYWNTENPNDRSTLQARTLYHLKTGECRKVPAVLRAAFDVMRVGDYLYMVKRSDTALTYADGTRRSYCHVYEYDLTDGEYREVYRHNDTIELVWGGNARIYFQQEVGTDEAREREFYSFNPETGQMRREPTLNLRTASYVYRNRVYAREVDMNTGITTVTAHDVTTGETDVILRDTLNSDIYLCEEGIYYIRMDEFGTYYRMSAAHQLAYETAYEAAKQAGDMDAVRRLTREREEERVRETVELLLPYDMEIWFCDSNGENHVKLCSLPFQWVGGFMTDGDMLYAYMSLRDRETGEELSRNERNIPVAVDMKTGRMTVLTPDALK